MEGAIQLSASVIDAKVVNVLVLVVGTIWLCRWAAIDARRWRVAPPPPRARLGRQSSTGHTDEAAGKAQSQQPRRGRRLSTWLMPWQTQEPAGVGIQELRSSCRID